eukprot:m.292136 g.292136  ORF g.292136 m.292136 type:complete len:518 (-) comp17823_c0_seq1:5057-6610(-)
MTLKNKAMTTRAFLALLLTAVTAAATKPNLLLLFPDQWRFDWDSMHQELDIPLRMPFLQSVIRNGTRFTKSFSPAPVCAPARSAIASGREYDQAGVACNFCNDYQTDIPTFYRLLRDDGGYHVMVTGKDDLTKATQPGPDGRINFDALGFSDGIRYSGKEDVVDKYPQPHELYGYMLRNNTVALENGTLVSAWTSHYSCMHGDASLCDATSFPDTLYEDDWTAGNAIELLRRKPVAKPWFMQVNFPGPHSPFLVTARQHDAEGGRQYPPPVDNKGFDKPEQCAITHEPSKGKRCDYAAELENLDRLFERVVDAIPADERDNTLLCISSDHGEMLFDHKDSGKTMPWQGSASVPLICQGLDVLVNQTIDTIPVSTMDLAATFLDYGQVTPNANMTSVSLRSLLTGGSSYRSHVSSGLQSSNFSSAVVDANGYNWRMVVKSVNNTIYKYICCRGNCPGKPTTAPAATSDGHSRLLYNVDTDPFDMTPIHDATLKQQLHPLLPSSFGCPPPPIHDSYEEY